MSSWVLGFFDSDGRIIAQAPKADIDLAAGPFLQGKIVIKRIVLVGVQLTLVRTVQGGLRLGMEKDKGEHDILSRISDAIATSNGKTSSLASFAIHNARLAFFDETTGLFVVAPHADFRLTTVGKNLDATIDAAIEISGHPAHIAAEITFPPNKGKVEGAIAVTGFEIGALADNSKTFAAVKDTLLKVDLSASFSVLGSHLVSADFGASARGAFAVPGSRNGPVHVRSLRAIGRYDGINRRLLLEDAVINSDKIKGHLSGSADLTVDETGALSRVGADFRIEKLLLAIPGIFAQPVAFQHVDLRGAWLPATRYLLIDHLGISGAPLSMQAAGKLTLLQNQSPAMELSGTVAQIGVRDLLRYWPIDAAKGARDWVDTNMFAGTAGPAAFQMHFQAGALDGAALPASALSVKFELHNGEINYIKGLTHMTQVQGTAELTGETFNAQVSSARVGSLALTGAHFTIPDLNVPNEAGDITGHVQGSMPDVLALVDMQPLRYPTRFGIVPGDTKGTADLDMSVHVPLSKSLGVDDIKVAIKATVKNFGIALGPHTRLTDGTVDFDIDNVHLHAIGTTGIGGWNPRDVGLDRRFQDSERDHNQDRRQGYARRAGAHGLGHSHQGLSERTGGHQWHIERTSRPVETGEYVTRSDAGGADARSDRREQARGISGHGAHCDHLWCPQCDRLRDSTCERSRHCDHGKRNLWRRRKYDLAAGPGGPYRPAGRFLPQPDAQCIRRGYCFAGAFHRRFPACRA